MFPNPPTLPLCTFPADIQTKRYPVVPNICRKDSTLKAPSLKSHEDMAYAVQIAIAVDVAVGVDLHRELEDLLVLPYPLALLCFDQIFRSHA